MVLGNLGLRHLRFLEPIPRLCQRHHRSLGSITELSKPHLGRQMSTRSTTTTATRPIKADISISSTTRRISSSYQNQPISTA